MKIGDLIREAQANGSSSTRVTTTLTGADAERAAKKTWAERGRRPFVPLHGPNVPEYAIDPDSEWR